MYSDIERVDTICALSTAEKNSAIGLIRVSGPQALKIARGLCAFIPLDPQSHRAYFGVIKDSSGDDIDEVLATFFAQGKSFCGDETVEISFHGALVIANEILKCLIEQGCRSARRGEFTYRSFMNGKMDLIQAEGVLGLVGANSKRGGKVALRQLRGSLSREINEVKDKLEWILSRLELNIDFSMENIAAASESEFRNTFSEVKIILDRLIDSYKSGKAIRLGLRVAIVGKTNVGKSSLFNKLCSSDRVIVSEVAGTTRDTVEEQVEINGTTITFVDTAGQRETDDPVELLGIERTMKEKVTSDFILEVIDSSDPDVLSVLKSAEPRENRWLILNKCDLISKEEIESLVFKLKPMGLVFPISVKNGTGLSELKNSLSDDRLSLSEGDGAVVSHARHFELLVKAREQLLAAERVLLVDQCEELASVDMRESCDTINEIFGVQFDEQLYDRIFNDFCIGK